MRIPEHIRRRLLLLTGAFVLSTSVLGIVFLRVPEALGVGRYESTVEFKEGAGLYDGAEVTYRGVAIGKVTGLALHDRQVTATMSLRTEVPVPADVTAAIRSRSAVGEQYVELLDGFSSAGGSLAAGSNIPLARTSQPIEIGPLLDNASALADSLDADDLNTTITELGDAFDGRSSDLQAIIDHGSAFTDRANANINATTRLIDKSGPLLRKVNGEREHIVDLTQSLSKVTRELKKGDDDLRRLLGDGPGFSREMITLLDDLDERLPAVLGPLNVVTRVLLAYDTHLDATLNYYPRSMATVQSVTLGGLNPPNKIRLTLSDIDNPAECTKGFLPTSQWASPFAANNKELPPLVYCKESHEDPRGVRGARNIPCPTNPAIRTGDAADCPKRKTQQGDKP